jgi:flavorubredoxin
MPSGKFQARKISSNVHWVGAIDWSLRDFHGYSTLRGTTYNAYLITADKITLIDTVKAAFRDELLTRISSVIPPDKIDYIISNHSEMDHTGSLAEIIKIVNPEKVFASINGVKALEEHFRLDRQLTAVKDGEKISLGNADLVFYETKMLHWPDSMFTFFAQEGVLFSQDAFGMHLASSPRFADEIEENVILEEGAKYFANILLPYSALVTNLLEKVGKLNLNAKVIAPDHGPIWRKDLAKILKLYSDWAEQRRRRKAVVAYATMWESTAAMAQAIGEGLTDGGALVKLMPLSVTERSDVATELLDAGALLVGSPTINGNIFPTMADLLYYVKGLKPKNLRGATFGSFGWSGEAVGQMNSLLQEMKAELLSEGIKSRYVPTAEVLAECYALGSAVAKKLEETCES